MSAPDGVWPPDIQDGSYVHQDGTHHWLIHKGGAEHVYRWISGGWWIGPSGFTPKHMADTGWRYGEPVAPYSGRSNPAPQWVRSTRGRWLLVGTEYEVGPYAFGNWCVYHRGAVLADGGSVWPDMETAKRNAEVRSTGAELDD